MLWFLNVKWNTLGLSLWPQLKVTVVLNGSLSLSKILQSFHSHQQWVQTSHSYPCMCIAVGVVLNNLFKSLPYRSHHWKPGICKHFLLYGVIIGCYALCEILLQDFSIHWLIPKVFGILDFFFKIQKIKIKLNKRKQSQACWHIYVFNPSMWEAVVGRSLWGGGLPGLHG